MTLFLMSHPSMPLLLQNTCNAQASWDTEAQHSTEAQCGPWANHVTRVGAKGHDGRRRMARHGGVPWSAAGGDALRAKGCGSSKGYTNLR